MQPISRPEFACRAAIALALAAALFLAWQLGPVLVLTFGGAVIAVVIRMAADPIAHVLKIKERWATLLVLLVVIALVSVGFYLFGNKVAEQLGRLSERLPEGLERVYEWIGDGGGQSFLAPGGDDQVLSLSGLMSAAGTTYGFFVDLVLVLLVAVYLGFNPSRYRRGVLALIPPARRNLADLALGTAGQALRGWLRGQLLAMAIVGLLTGLGLWLVGVPLALTLGLIAGVLEFIPIVGPFMAAVPGILLALTIGPMTAVYATLVYLVVQQLETNLITPLAQRWAVHLPPALNIVGLVVLGTLFGLPGLIFAAPFTVVLMTLTQRLYVDKAPP